MASITKQPNGRRTIQFVGVDGKRRSIRLGKVSQRVAEAVKVRVEHLISAKAGGTTPDPDTARWLAGIADDLRDKLIAVGLAGARASATVGDFTERYITERVDLKPATIRNLNRARANLLEYFGHDKPLSSITPGDADGFRLHLISVGLRPGTTARRRMGRVVQLFRAAVRRGLIGRNPFEGQKTAVASNPERFAFISRETAEKVLDACPNSEWRLIFALARYGGFRTPSETLALRWQDVDWEHNRITVRSPKTEHHEGGESRIIPIFSELRPYLEQAWDLAEPGTEYVINRYRDSNANLRTQFLRIVRRAGVAPWEKPFQNLRSTRQTELSAEYPQHVVCKWLGNSQPVAMKHYLQTTDEHFQKAAGKAVQNPVQSAHGNASQGSPQETENLAIPEKDEVCSIVNSSIAPRQGLEPWT